MVTLLLKILSPRFACYFGCLQLALFHSVVWRHHALCDMFAYAILRRKRFGYRSGYSETNTLALSQRAGTPIANIVTGDLTTLRVTGPTTESVGFPWKCHAFYVSPAVVSFDLHPLFCVWFFRTLACRCGSRTDVVFAFSFASFRKHLYRWGESLFSDVCRYRHAARTLNGTRSRGKSPCQSRISLVVRLERVAPSRLYRLYDMIDSSFVCVRLPAVWVCDTRAFYFITPKLSLTRN